MLTVILLMSWFGFSPQARTGNNKQPFTLVISPWTDVLPAGTDVWIKVSLTNNSKRDLDDSGNTNRTNGLDPNFQFEVRDVKGDLVLRRRYEHPELDTGQPVNRTLQPGESVTQDQRVSALYDITRPGKYTIQVLMPVPGTLGKSFVKSNIITVTLTKQSG